MSATRRRVLRGDKLLFYRDLRMMNQQELADAAGVTKSTVSRLENGYHRPHWDTVRQLAQALDIDPNELLEWRNGPELTSGPTMLNMLNTSM